MFSFGERLGRAIFGIAALSLAFSACKGRDSDLPERYRGRPVPEARLRSADAQARGRKLFLEHCVLCHGENADGQGVRREGLSSAPRDFTDSAWRRRVSPRHVFYTIREGSPGTPMPAWKTLNDDETWDLAAYLLAVADRPRGNR
jgi:mono/diheme cytochrome c family protein